MCVYLYEGHNLSWIFNIYLTNHFSLQMIPIDTDKLYACMFIIYFMVSFKKHFVYSYLTFLI